MRTHNVPTYFWHAYGNAFTAFGRWYLSASRAHFYLTLWSISSSGLETKKTDLPQFFPVANWKRLNHLSYWNKIISRKTIAASKWFPETIASNCFFSLSFQQYNCFCVLIEIAVSKKKEKTNIPKKKAREHVVRIRDDQIFNLVVDCLDNYMKRFEKIVCLFIFIVIHLLGFSAIRLPLNDNQIPAVTNY